MVRSIKYEFSSLGHINGKFVDWSPIRYTIEFILYLNISLSGTNNVASSAYLAMQLYT